MKKIKILFIILISFSFTLTSCADQEHYDDMSNPHNQGGGVGVTVYGGTGAGQQGSVPTVPVMIPVSTGKVYLSGAYIPSTYWFFDPYLQPTEWYRVIVTIGNADYQVAVTSDMVEDMKVFAMSNGYDFVNVSVGTLVGNGYSVPQVIGYF